MILHGDFAGAQAHGANKAVSSNEPALILYGVLGNTIEPTPNAIEVDSIAPNRFYEYLYY